ncbi:hypothetical protein MM300_21950 [Evansella sp. LMS18]|uniref:hypothetical protein n=1 Tax=Evansella sp. LMS18 TaxID=2924033 RepID=UPI0020D1A38A|nr:hypothetical protein [Evansella sp. LMS18]UTR10499.1 hypothetical protein MM300_21950 [Evansella sp. LMS18]
MKLPRKVLFAMLFLSWISIPFIGWKDIRRFLPSYFFIAFLLLAESYPARKLKWWHAKTNVSHYTDAELPFIAGGYLASLLWVMKLTYGRFLSFAIVNLVMNLMFAYPLSWISRKLNIYSLDRMPPFIFFLLMYAKSFLLYGFQRYILLDRPSTPA